MRIFSRPALAVAAPLAALLAACSPAPAPAPTPAAGTTPAASPAGGDASGAYDPKQDSLVNPASSYERAPADPALLATDEVLYRTLEGNPASLNPLFFNSQYEAMVSDMMFEGPISWDAKMKWRLNENVAESLEESEDHVEWTIRLKPGLKWHDGHPYTAHDICFSWKEILDERVPCPSVRPGTDQIAGCTAVDDRTVKFVHKEPLPTNAWNVAYPIIPRHLYEKEKKKNPDLKTGEYYNKLNREPVGNGPFKFVKWIENDRIELERWEDYPGTKPHIKRFVYRIIQDRNIMLLSFNKGDTDEFRLEAKAFAKQTGPDTDFAKLGLKILAPQWDYAFIAWNMDGSNPFFNDVRVRRAMTHATNVKRMVRDLAYNLYEPCYGIFHPDSWMFNSEVQLIPYDLDQASRLLDEAGWKVDEAQEGWRYKLVDGKPLRFEFTLLLSQASNIGRELAAILQEDLKGIGVKMNTEILEWATFQERQRKHEFQAHTAAWGTGTDPDTQWNMWRSDEYDKAGRFGRNFGGYSNPRVDELLQLARHEFDPGKRAGHYREMQKIIYDEQPYTFLYNRATLWALNKRIRGVERSPRGIYGFEPAEKAWWVPAGQARAAVTTP